MREVISSGRDAVIFPNESSTCEVLLSKGSRTLKKRWSASQGKRLWTLFRGVLSKPEDIFRAPSTIDPNHPVEPQPVETIIPFDDCCYSLPPKRTLHLGEIWLRGPMKMSFTPWMVWPSFSEAFAMLIADVSKSPFITRPRWRSIKWPMKSMLTYCSYLHEIHNMDREKCHLKYSGFFGEDGKLPYIEIRIPAQVGRCRYWRLQAMTEAKPNNSGQNPPPEIQLIRRLAASSNWKLSFRKRRLVRPKLHKSIHL